MGIAGIEAAFLFANQRDRGPAIWGPYYGARVGQKTVTPSFSQIKGSFSKHIVGFPDLNKYVIPWWYLGYSEDDNDEDVDVKDADYDGDDGVYDDDEHDFVLLNGFKCRSRINFFVVDLFE